MCVCVRPHDPPSVGPGLDSISRMSVSPVWRRPGRIYCVSPPVISSLRPLTDKGDDGRIAFRRECQFGGLAVRFPPRRELPLPPLLNISLLQLTPSEPGEIQPQNESPALGAGPGTRGRGRGAGDEGPLLPSTFKAAR